MIGGRELLMNIESAETRSKNFSDKLMTAIRDAHTREAVLEDPSVKENT